MLNKINYGWRVVATGFCFLTFSVGGVILTVFIFPMVNFLSFDKAKRQRRVQSLIHFFFKQFVNMLSGTGLFRFHLSGHEELASAKGQLIIANHPTLIDVVVLMSMMPKAQCVVKHELWDNKYMGGVIRSAGYIRNDDDPEKLIELCSEMLSKGENIILFPEGTRTIPGKSVKFKRGFANVALNAGVDILKVNIDCVPSTLAKGDAWYQIPSRRADFTVSVGDTLDIAPYLEQEPRSVVVRKIARDLEHYYAGNLING